MTWLDLIKRIKAQHYDIFWGNHTEVHFTNNSMICSCGLSNGSVPSLRSLETSSPESVVTEQ